jgi:hypothetical protein
MNDKKDIKKSAADLLSESLMQDLIDSGSDDLPSKKAKGDQTRVAQALLQGDGVVSNEYTGMADPEKTGPVGLIDTPEIAGRLDVEEVASLEGHIEFPSAKIPSNAPNSDLDEVGKTIVNQQFARIKPQGKPEPKVEAKVSQGASRPPNSFDYKFGQAETLKLAQKRINELEKQLEKVRRENEVMAAAGELSKIQAEELMSKIRLLERENFEYKDTNENELQMFKEALQQKDVEKAKLRIKIEELENRLAQDMRRIRVRERELENRLELARVEKNALTRAKDESILELKRKMDSLESEVDTYKNRIVELQNRIESNQEQFGRTVRALRLALTNLEATEDDTNIKIPISRLKKAE